ALYASDQQNLVRIGMPAAWDVSLGAASVITAVLDTGIAFAHPDLDSRIANLTGAGLPGADHVFLSYASPGCPAPTSPDEDAWGVGRFSHGTHIAGIIAAESSLTGQGSAGIAGIAPGSRVAPVKVLD